jgi:hypothetical protein
MTTRIGLITTGDCEQRALVPSLARVFADHDVAFELSFAKPVHSVTSNRLSYPAPLHGGKYIDDFVAAIDATISMRGAPDFVFAIDDLELPNASTPHHVTALIRDAVLALPARATHRGAQRFQDRCSVHFLCPMVEAYFFGEPAALLRASATRPAELDATRHLEAFAAVDPAFLALPSVRGHPWRSEDRKHHPKHYLRFLNDPTDEEVDRYRETRHGRDALATLDWATVFAYEPTGITFARSLFDDLADALGIPSPFPGNCHPLTERRQNGVLRNL